MSPPILDPNILQFDIWETLDEVTMEMASTSEFWTQVDYEVDRLDFVPPSNPDSLDDSDPDWRIPDSPEDHKDNIVHHDCMWAGSCVDSAVHPSNTFVPTDLISATPGQSLLRRDISPPRPETPPSLDGDEQQYPFEHVVDVASAARRLVRDSAAVAADHSYTIARQRIDYLGVQTPSDSCESEEEIDVVSLGTTHQPLPGTTQSRDSYSRSSSSQDLLYSPQQTPRPAARKRLIPPTSIPSASVPRRKARGPGRRGRRSNTDTDSEAEAPDIERRSIHNDMERQRRIGLKNLFDELKKQIPATRDKERAPKVVILREAAALCRKLREDDYERENLQKQQNKLVAKLRKLRMMVSRYRVY
ncbi:Myc protein [Papilio machaon]|uniref:Myc protein n=1 Tax=Papilio machaon TaxID=76193 RepID=A0A194QPL3_PAPMA|nr:myc proto-oncogene protein [Papilio machaon]XP_014368660.1 myc proto-oncogene protein [Papilio machaon]KPJ07478.1 Myc protein [Papilio machaon]